MQPFSSSVGYRYKGDFPVGLPVDGDNWLEQRLGLLPRARVAVFGDFCLDAYWLIDSDESELSLETNLPVRRVRQQRYSLGGASNIVANLAALEVGQVRAVGLIGEDLFGRQMRRILQQLKVNCDGMLSNQADWQTMVFSKPCVDDVEQSRIDFGAFDVLGDETADALARQLAGAAEVSDVVILNQQVPAGVSTPEMIQKINAVVAAHRECTFIVDSRHRAEFYAGCLLKLNAHEAARLLGEPRPLDERVPAAQAKDFAARLAARADKAAFVTRGENGLIVADGGGLHEIPGIQTTEQTDPVGAGDTVVATIAAAIASGADAVTAATLANIAASITVRKLQTTGTASREEIRHVGATPDYIYLPELADEPRQARYVEGTEIETVRSLPDGARIRHAIFDHDGTISTLRQGWEGIMGPVMIRAILGPRYQDADEAAYHKAVDAVGHFIDKTTGVQTLVQMQGLVRLVRRFGFVEQSRILDMHGYKAVYNEELLKMVRRRLAKLNRGELQETDFQMSGARKFAEALHARGVKLYLASGTDHEDLASEAKALGYAHLFEGRIFGAVGDIQVEAKRIVIERILREHGLSGGELVTFGDGPVEIRETHKREGITVGVASNEVQRFGLSTAKRTRLILAGADLIVPDFTQAEELLKVLRLA